MTVEIPPELLPFVQHVIEIGNFRNETEVVGEALRLLRQRQLYELRADIDAAAAQLDRGEGIELESEQALREFFEDVKSSGMKRLAAKQDAR